MRVLLILCLLCLSVACARRGTQCDHPLRPVNSDPAVGNPR